MGEPERIHDALRRITGRLTHARDLRCFLGELLHEALRLLGAARGHIFIYEPHNDSFVYATGSNSDAYYLEPEADEPERFRGRFSAASFPVFGWIKQHQRVAILTRDGAVAPLPPDLAEWFQRKGFRDAIGLPLLAGDDPVGFLGLLFDREVNLSCEQWEFIETIGNHAALAVRMARLAEQAEVAAKQAAVNEERTRLARELHDSLAQGFAGISVLLESTKRVMRTNPDKAAGCVADALTLARVGLSEVRRAIWALRPSDLDGASLTEAIQRLIERGQRDATTRFDIRTSGHAVRCHPQEEGELLRIVQEAITNSLRHAGAKVVSISFDWGEDTLQVTVTDDGCGFDTEQPADGFGLVSMRERAAHIGASLRIVSTPGAGTQVLVTFPLPKEQP